MVTNYPQQLTAVRSHGERPATSWPARWPASGSCSAGFADTTRAALRGQARDDALHVVRPRHAGLGNQRTRPAPALRRRRAPAPARHHAAEAGPAQDRLTPPVAPGSARALRRRFARSRTASGYAVFAASERQHVPARLDIGDGHVFLGAVQPAPPGPNSTDGIPAAPSTAASVQKLMPTVSTRQAERASAARRARRGSSCPDGISYGGPRERQARLGARTPDPRARSASRMAPTSRAASSPASPATRPPFHLQQAPIRIAAQLPSAVDDRRVQRRRAHQRMRRPRLQLAIERLEAVQHAAHAQDRVAAVARTAAVRRAAARLDLEPGESLVRRRRSADRSARSRPRASALHRLTSASAPMLAYSSSTTAATISRPRAKPRSRDDPRRVDHRGDAAFMSCAPRP